MIAEGVDRELDELRHIAFEGKDYLLKIQQRETELTGIPSLKISYNNVFGYYLEVRNTHKDKVPADWIRKQTLVNAERYITQELKEYEEKIMGAHVIKSWCSKRSCIMNWYWPWPNSRRPSRLMPICWHGWTACCLFAQVAQDNRYIRPVIQDDDVLDIKQGGVIR